ncbi:potassium channel family protein [Parathermosynechococcus lividus]|jgi:trk system potassium uptake protein TrkA|uniref:Potassium transporter n=2 Tax=Parathermosynechococcus lividus TaxID=33070 RepID=A0A2D2Q2Z1_PARLV|nr:potassium transporter [Thermostichus lividus PCC 6715]MCH9055565.1 TrkA family potassium uptake protein [Synechococcus sp. PCC 6716]
MDLGAMLFRGRELNVTQQFAVIGLGRFGRGVCGTLHDSGYEVLGTDNQERLVNQVLQDRLVNHAIQLDSTDPQSLKEAGLFEFETVIVAIGNHLDASIITTLNLKEAGVPKVIAKASSEVHKKLLERVGADLVVFPEYEAGCELARSLTRPAILDSLALDPEKSIIEVKVPDAFHNKTIMEVGLRSRYGLNLIALRCDQKFEIIPDPNQKLKRGDIMVVIGANTDIDRFLSSHHVT